MFTFRSSLNAEHMRAKAVHSHRYISRYKALPKALSSLESAIRQYIIQLSIFMNYLYSRKLNLIETDA